MNKQIDNIVSQLNALKSMSSKTSIPTLLLEKWENSNTVSDLQKITTADELRLLCNYFDLKETGQKKILATRLWEHWESVESDSESESDSEADYDSESGSEDESESEYDSEYED